MAQPSRCSSMWADDDEGWYFGEITYYDVIDSAFIHGTSREGARGVNCGNPPPRPPRGVARRGRTVVLRRTYDAHLGGFVRRESDYSLTLELVQFSLLARARVSAARTPEERYVSVVLRQLRAAHKGDHCLLERLVAASALVLTVSLQLP